MRASARFGKRRRAGWEGEGPREVLVLMIVDVVTFGLTVDGMAISAHATLITLLYLHDQCIGVIVWIRFRQGDLLAVMLLLLLQLHPLCTG